jgi:hypothetical protein
MRAIKVVVSFLLIGLSLWEIVVFAQQNGGSAGMRKHKQDVRSRSTGTTAGTTTTAAATTATTSATTSATINKATPNKESAGSSSANQHFDQPRCPHCPDTKNLVKVALQRFWENDLVTALGCACNALKSKNQEDGARSILHTLRPLIKPAAFAEMDKSWFDPPINDAPALLKNWELLGPFPVGKMELDADPTFVAMRRDQFPYSIEHTGFDPAAYILSLPTDNTTIHSELISDTDAHWKKVNAKSNGQVCNYWWIWLLLWLRWWLLS